MNFCFQILRKNDELQMAAELGKKMLQKNDELKTKCAQLEEEHENVVKVRLCKN